MFKAKIWKWVGAAAMGMIVGLGELGATMVIGKLAKKQEPAPEIGYSVENVTVVEDNEEEESEEDAE